MKRLSLIVLGFITINLHAQVVNTAVMDTTAYQYKGKVSVEGYIDGYYSYDFNKPRDGNRPYAVSMSRHNEMTINLAFVDLKYSSSRLRARVAPGFGTYVNANYTSEPGALKYLIEANAGIKIFKNRSVWIDFGVLGSPYTNESAISKDHLAYTRSIAAEFVPYYLSGVKMSVPISPKLNAYVYLINGWQQIQDNNSNKSVGTQLEYRPNKNWLLNWNTYVGGERSEINPSFGTRYFTDAYFLYQGGKWAATGCVYVGVQKMQSSKDAMWWQANIIGRYDLGKSVSLTGRFEYFDDPDRAIVAPVTGLGYFSCYSSSIGLNQKPAENVLLRLEYRTFHATKEVFQVDDRPVKNDGLVTANLTMWF